MPYMPDFQPVINTYTLHNATPEEIVLKWGGLQMTLPPVDKVGARPAVDPAGEPIPGTRTISDTYTAISGSGQTPRKGDPPNWFAAAAIKNILKIDPRSGEAIGKSAQKGVSVLPGSPTLSMITQAKADGHERYQQFLVDWATDTVNAYQVARERNQQAGYAPPPPGADYQRSIIILEKSHAKMQKDMGMVSKVEDIDLQDEGTDEELEAWVLGEAMKRAKEPAEDMKLDQTELAAELLKNPKIRQALRKKGLRIRNVGHVEGEVPEGD
jgi:hypothetical protein